MRLLDFNSRPHIQAITIHRLKFPPYIINIKENYLNEKNFILSAIFDISMLFTHQNVADTINGV